MWQVQKVLHVSSNLNQKGYSANHSGCQLHMWPCNQYASINATFGYPGHAPILGCQTLENADEFSGTRTDPWSSNLGKRRQSSTGHAPLLGLQTLENADSTFFQFQFLNSNSIVSPATCVWKVPKPQLALWFPVQKPIVFALPEGGMLRPAAVSS
jgi:hypothetical protein